MAKINPKQLERFMICDEPIPYKQLLIYPVTVKDYTHFQMAINCLLINKNRIPDPRIISMSYLDYIFYIASQNEESQVYLYMLVELLKMCLKITEENIKSIKDDLGKVNLVLNDEKYDKNDFNIIREIICYQNNVELPDEDIDPKLEKALQEMAEHKAKYYTKTCSFEDQIVCVMVSTSMSLDSIRNMSVRKFFKVLERVDKKMHYEIMMSAKMSGMVEFKEEIDHWMSEIKINKYRDMIDYDNFKGKVEGSIK